MSIDDMITELWTNLDISDVTIAKIAAALKAGENMRDQLEVAAANFKVEGYPKNARNCTEAYMAWDAATEEGVSEL